MFLGEENGIKFGDTDDFRTVFLRANKIGTIEKNGKSSWVFEGKEYDSFRSMRDLWVNDRVAYERAKKAVIRSVVQDK